MSIRARGGRAILAGHKTQTRRVVQFPRRLVRQFGANSEMHRNADIRPDDFWVVGSDGQGNPIREWQVGDERLAPNYQPGDRLWVRETWASAAKNNVVHPVDDYVIYRATDPEWGTEFEGWRWRPSVHMPRWASRITLDVISVRVQRVQDISEADSIAEGIPTFADGSAHGCAYDGFRELWDSLNARRGYGWDMNPWVWAIGFTLAAGGGAR